MQDIQWYQHVSVIRGIEEHLGLQPLTNEADRLFIEDIISKENSGFHEVAQKYTSGDLQQLLRQTERILNEYVKFLLDLDVYHNDIQKTTSQVGICWQGTKKMVHLGYRSGAIKNAELIYQTAVSCHDYETASSIASTLSHHYGHIADREDLCDEWYKKFEACYDQNYWVQEARHNYAKLMIAIRRNKDNSNLQKIDKALAKLSEYKEDAQSYMYWYCYYQANSIASETKGDYQKQLASATKGYEYFDKLDIDHRDAKFVMLSHMIHAYNLLHQYEQANQLESLITNTGEVNGDMLALRYSCTSLNIGDIGKALRYLDQITNHPSVLPKVPLYRSYCLGELVNDGRDDTKEMKTAYLIADLYCSIREGKTDLYKHDYLLQYIESHKLDNTREGLIIEILSLFRYRYSDQERYSEISGLAERLPTVKLASPEAEVLRFETMIEDLTSS